MSFAQRWRDIRTGFERPFWVANISELFERLSYYAAFASLARYLHEAWWRAPDREEIHSIPNWCLLCDLLSEEPGCLEPEPPEENEPDLEFVDQKEIIENGVGGWIANKKAGG